MDLDDSENNEEMPNSYDLDTHLNVEDSQDLRHEPQPHDIDFPPMPPDTPTPKTTENIKDTIDKILRQWTTLPIDKGDIHTPKSKELRSRPQRKRERSPLDSGDRSGKMQRKKFRAMN